MLEQPLSVSQIMTEVGWPDRSSLVRLLSEPGTAELLGVVPGPRPSYPRASLPLFKVLRDAHLAGTVKPKTAQQFIREYITGKPATEHSETNLSDFSDNPQIKRLNQALFGYSETAPSEYPSAPEPSLPEPTRFMVEILAQAIHEALMDTAPVRDDRLLTRVQAAELLACSPRSVRRYVKPIPGRRAAWKYSAVMRAIQEMS